MTITIDSVLLFAQQHGYSHANNFFTFEREADDEQVFFDRACNTIAGVVSELKSGIPLLRVDLFAYARERDAEHVATLRGTQPVIVFDTIEDVFGKAI